VIARQMSGGSTLICFDVKGGKKAAYGFENGLEVIQISNNLGDAKSLITHPATTTHKNLAEERGWSSASIRARCGCLSAWRMPKT
jgi:O-succinylhomoserine sulfhydrylase